MDNVRKIVLKTLAEFYKNVQYSDIALDNVVLNNTKLNKSERKDIAFMTRLFYGVIEKQLYIDFILSDLISKGIEKTDEYVRNILRMGIYEIEFMDSVPHNATCFECVEIIKSYNKNAAGLVNGVLRNFIRNRDNIYRKISNLQKKEKLSVLYSIPLSMIDLWEMQYGSEICERLVTGCAVKNPLCLTVNTLKTSVENFLQIMQDAADENDDIKCERTKYSERGIRFYRNTPISSIIGYNEGLFFVQDETSQICASEAEAQEGDFVLDMCAAPGGKSFYMAMDMKNRGKILSFDLHENKVKIINESAKRLNIDIIESERHNSALLKEELKGRADKVVCDVPCSGFGVINKKPEIKYKNYGDFSSLCKTQYEILSVSSNYVKENGILVYSTCTLNKKENEEIVHKFLSENKNFRCIEFKNKINDLELNDTGEKERQNIKGIKTFFPYNKNNEKNEKIDGFFLVKMIRYNV